MTQHLITRNAALDLAIEEWLKTKEGRSNSTRTRDTYAAHLAHFRATLAEFGYDLDSVADQSLVKVIRSIAVNWAARPILDRRTKQMGSPQPSTKNLRLSAISSFYRYALTHEFLTGANPIDGCERSPTQPYQGAKPLPRRMVIDSLAAIDLGTLEGLRDYALILVGLVTGRRVSELSSLTTGDIQRSGDILTLSFRRLKGGKAALDELPPDTSAALLDYLTMAYGETMPVNVPVWVAVGRAHKGQALGAQGISGVCLRRLGEGKVHALRHTFAAEMRAAGADVVDIQGRLHHSSLAVTGRYIQQLESAKNKHGAALESRFTDKDAA